MRLFKVGVSWSVFYWNWNMRGFWNVISKVCEWFGERVNGNRMKNEFVILSLVIGGVIIR